MALPPKIKVMIGFAARSRTLLLGTYAVEQSIRQRRAKLILAAEDSNEKRLEILRLWCSDMDIPFLAVGTKEEYGVLLHRAPTGLLALTDAHMVSGILQAVEANGGV